jgi:transcriptional regulator with XRE-family HTH domain
MAFDILYRLAYTEGVETALVSGGPAMQFGERLKQLRVEAKLSQPALAEKAGTNVWNIRNWEHGRREPDWRALLNLSAALGVQAEAFADCTDASADGGENKATGASGRPAGKRGMRRASAGSTKPTRAKGTAKRK